MTLFSKKNKRLTGKGKRLFKIVKKNLKEQEFDLPDGSKVKMKIKPKLGNKSKIEIKWDKKIEDVDLYISFKGQPIRIYQEGFVYDPSESEYAKFEIGAKTKF